jgi:hypothetical protein
MNTPPSLRGVQQMNGLQLAFGTKLTEKTMAVMTCIFTLTHHDFSTPSMEV